MIVVASLCVGLALGGPAGGLIGLIIGIWAADRLDEWRAAAPNRALRDRLVKARLLEIEQNKKSRRAETWARDRRPRQFRKGGLGDVD